MSLLIIGVALLSVPFLTVWFAPYFPRCEYGFVNPLLNLLPLNEEFPVVALSTCGLGYLLLLLWIYKTYKIKTRNFKFFLVLLVTVFALFMASIVLASLNTSRSKPANAEMKAYISRIRGEAELYFDTHIQNGYKGFCSSDGLLSEQKRVLERTTSSEYCYVPTDMIRCIDAKEGYAISGKTIYKGKEGYFCADSAGFVGEIRSHVEGISCVRK